MQKIRYLEAGVSMTNNQIHYMVEVASAGSVNQAARNLFISQSSLSNAIQSVEAEFGRKIFIRSARGMSLTPFGRQFIAYITPIDQQLHQLYAMRSTELISGQSSLSIISNGFYYISDIIAELSKSCRETGLRISSREDYSGNIIDALIGREADLAIVRIWSCYRDQLFERFLSANLLYHPISEMCLGVDIGPHNPLYNSVETSITPEQLAGFPQIMDESLEYGPYADIFPRINLPVEKNRFIVNSRAATYELLDLTDGYVLNSRKSRESSYASYSGHKWRFFPLQDCSITSEIGWVTREGAPLSSEAKKFIQLLQHRLLYIDYTY